MAKKKISYQAKPGGVLTDKQATAVGQEWELMEKSEIPVTPATLVSRARAEDSPLHELFEWDDTAAAEKYRKKQAQKICQSVTTIEVRVGRQARAVYSITLEKSRVYMSRARVLVDDRALMDVSEQLYARAVQAVDEAESLDLGKTSSEWARIIAAVRSNPPMSLTG